MATYGKKKRSLLPSLSSFRDSGSKAKDKSKQKESLVQTPVFPEPQGKEEERDESMGERTMASKLLDDTTNELQPAPGRPLSRIPRNKTINNLAQHTQFDNEKSLPQLPKLQYNGDDAWAMKTASVVTADGNANRMYFDGDEGSSTQPMHSEDSEKSPPPPIPPKSSKRKSVQPKTNHAMAQGGNQIKKTSSSDPIELDYSFTPTQYANEDVAIQAMLSANLALKGSTNPQGLETSTTSGITQSVCGARKAMGSGTDQALLQGPYVSTKKRGFMESKVFAKMKTAVDRFQVGNSRSRRDSARGESLLNPSNSELQEWEEVSPMEIGLNEGKTLIKPEASKLGGNGGIKRKPVADHGKSLKSTNSKQTGGDSFLEAPQSTSWAVTPTSNESPLGDDMELDQSTEFVPDPMLPSPTPTQTRPRTPKQTGYMRDLDAMLSSSPQGQSTPRLRLEPSFENGEKKLRKVRSDSRSGFDSHSNFSYGVLPSEMDMEVEQIGVAVPMEDTPKRKGSQEIRSPMKRSKKHPSPKREDLEQLALAMNNFKGEEKGPAISVTDRPLSTKDANEKMKTGKGHMHGKVAFAKQELPRTTGSMPNLGAKGLKSAMRKPATENGGNSQHGLYFSQSNLADGSMDVDELQWNNTEYNIGGRKL